MRYFIPPLYPSELPYGRIEPEVAYYRRLVMKVCQFEVIPTDYLPVSPELACFDRPFNTIHWVNRFRWGNDAGTEAQIRTRHSYTPVMHMFHQVEFFSQSVKGRRDWYVARPPWWEAFEVLMMLSVPTPPVLAYFGSHVTRNLERCYLIWWIALTEWTILVAILALTAARDGVNWDCRARDADIYRNCVQPPGSMFYIPPKVVRNIRPFGIANMVAGTDYSPEQLDSLLTQVEAYSWADTQGWEVFDPVIWKVVPRDHQYYLGA
eukprot:TRINITY_DN2600_c0_g1_i1.p1 TRINITY_DN2600_c0_g1~~TRINITY_DN2600_c0_g1_i1.p1  ORF type:complete len:264 (+),score=8.55 TRINITY_DN2600_c0_g1_i1:1330-2121(+)